MSKVSAINIQITSGDTRPIFKQIVDGIRMQIASGNLSVGAKLPSVRGLAMQLTINPNTVAKAYTELTNQGLLEPQQGLGLFVTAPRQQLSIQEQEKRLSNAIDNFVNEVAYLDFNTEQVLGATREVLQKLVKKGTEQ
jgi:GntR family transcriptional regulator